MKNKILMLTILAVLLAYVVAAFAYSSSVRSNGLVRDVRVELFDTVADVSVSDIGAFLKARDVILSGKQYSGIDYDSLERLVETHPLVKRAECYLSADDDVVIRVVQRVPVARVFADSGDTYFIGDEAERITCMEGISPYVPVLSGDLTYEFVRDTLFDLVTRVREDDFWRAQVEQIYVAPNRDITLIPRVGQMDIKLGKAESLQTKLDNLKLFYKEAPQQVGWNKYKSINAEFENQIIAEK